MVTYKIQMNKYGRVCSIVRSDEWHIPVNPDNTDYANFKAQINSDEAQLEDAEGTLMTAEQAKEFVKELP